MAKPTKKIKEISNSAKKPNCFEINYANFYYHLNLIVGIKDLLPKLIEDYHEKNIKGLKKRKNNFTESEKSELSAIEGAEEFLKKIKEGKELDSKNKKISKYLMDTWIIYTAYMKTTEFTREMSLVYLVAIFEDFLKTTFKIALNKNIKTLIAKEKNITYEELLKYKSLEDIKRKIIEKELTQIMYQDIDGINQTLTKKFGFNLTEIKEDWNEFKEIFYRRNIIIHNQGYINEIYKSKTGHSKKNEKIHVTKTYLDRQIRLADNFAKLLTKVFSDKFNK